MSQQPPQPPRQRPPSSSSQPVIKVPIKINPLPPNATQRRSRRELRLEQIAIWSDAASKSRSSNPLPSPFFLSSYQTSKHPTSSASSSSTATQSPNPSDPSASDPSRRRRNDSLPRTRTMPRIPQRHRQSLRARKEDEFDFRSTPNAQLPQRDDSNRVSHQRSFRGSFHASALPRSVGRRNRGVSSQLPSRNSRPPSTTNLPRQEPE